MSGKKPQLRQSCAQPLPRSVIIDFVAVGELPHHRRQANETWPNRDSGQAHFPNPVNIVPHQNDGPERLLQHPDDAGRAGLGKLIDFVGNDRLPDLETVAGTLGQRCHDMAVHRAKRCLVGLHGLQFLG
jgi:hypothetical protein